MRDRPIQVEHADTARVTALVARAKQGDREAFDGLVEIYTPRIYNLALRITGSREEAEDCVQEAFLRAFSGLRGFRGEAAFATWLYRVAVNISNDTARRRARQPLSVSELADSSSGDAPPELDRVARPDQPGANSPQDAALRQQKRRIILEAIRSLPEKHRAVVVLYDLQDLSYEQIARITNTRIGTVKSRLNRARLALRELLSDHMELLRE